MRTRAQQEGGGATVSTETAALLLLRACNCSAEQFQALTQPFGYRMPTTEEEFARLCSHIRRLGHIVERQPLNIASSLRHGQHHQHFLVDEEQAMPSQPMQSMQQWPGEGAWSSAAPAATWGAEATTWAYPVVEGASDTDSATSSDSGGFLDTSDIAHLTEQEVDLYLFGEL